MLQYNVIYIVHVGDSAAQISKKIICENKNLKFLVWSPLPQKFSKLSGIFWLKYISTSYYRHFTLQCMLFSDLSGELHDFL